MKETEKVLLTDLYQLTMNAAYVDNEKAEDIATFDLFIRKLPKDWGYFIASGIDDAIDYATSLQFTEEDIDYLREQGLFKESYLDYLRAFRFEGEIFAIAEGTPVTANEPILRVTAKRSQAQFLETTLLNMINFQTMIATKANRIVNAAGDAKCIEFGLRRAQEADAAMKGARASYIGGFVGTSNVKAGKEYGIPISGTHAHSFVMSFPTELAAFRAYTRTFPNHSTLLIDTYDVMQGVANAAIVAKELELQGHTLGAVRLDSGDLAADSKAVRAYLDSQGLLYIKIIASNDLNEYRMAELRAADAPINGYGVGTENITAKPVAAIPGVYKLVEDEDGAKIKLAPDKQTYPGRKQIFRVFDESGMIDHDILGLEGEEIDGTPLLQLVVKAGQRIRERMSLVAIREYASSNVACMPEQYKQVRTDYPYSFTVSPCLAGLIDETRKRFQIQRGVLHENRDCTDRY